MSDDKKSGINLNYLVLIVVVIVIALIVWKHQQATLRQQQALIEQAQLEQQRSQQAIAEQQALEQQYKQAKRQQLAHAQASKHWSAEESAQTLQQLQALSGRWRALINAAQTGDNDAVGRLALLQQQVEALLVPECLVTPKQRLLSGMENGLAAVHQALANGELGQLVASKRYSEAQLALAEFERGAQLCSALE